MPAWTAFAGLTGVVLLLLLVLARLTEAQVTGGTPETGTYQSQDQPSTGPATGSAQDPSSTGSATDSTETPESAIPDDEWRWGPDRTTIADGPWTSEGPSAPDRPRSGDAPSTLDTTNSRDANHPRSPTEPELADLPKPALLANVALSQGLFGLVLAVGAWWTEIPLAALGLAPVVTPELLGVGVALGLVLWVVNELAGRVGARFGIDGGERLRELLAPDTPGGWVLLLAGVLPLVALFEEFLFRAALVGVLGVGFGLPPWLLVVGSSVAFAVGHGAQGRVGMVVTGTLGLVLATAFVATGSLFVVVVAHYLVNALEFVVHEGRNAGV